MRQNGFAPILIVILIAAVAGLGGFLIYSQQPKTTLPQKQVATSSTPQPTPDETVNTEASRSANWKTYTNKEYGYTIFYPPNYLLDASLSSYITLSIPKNINDPHGEVISIFRVQTEKFSKNGIVKSFRDYLEFLKSECLADYPGKDYCDEVIKNEPYTNSVGVKGFEVYLRHVHESGNPNDKPVYSTKGPIYVFESVNHPAMIYLDSSYGYSSPSDEKLFKQIVDTFKFTP